MLLSYKVGFIGEADDHMNPDVESVFNSYPVEFRRPLLELRELIYRTADATPAVKEIEESLKWGEPSYATKPKTGTPIRIDRFGEDKIALFFHCQTNLVETFRTMFNGVFEFSKNRAIVFDPYEELPKKELALCIEMALTYHSNKVV